MDDYVNAGRWFSILHRRSQLFVVEACQKLHLTFSEYILLSRLFDHEGAKQDELAAMLYLDKAVVTRTINLLQEKGFIVRETDRADRRVKHIFLTEYGRAQQKFLNGILQGWVDYLVCDMEPGEVQAIFQGVSRLVDKACDADIVNLVKNLPTGGEVHETI